MSELRDIHEDSGEVDYNQSIEIPFPVPYPGSIRVSGLIASKNLPPRRDPDDAPELPAPSITHKLELFRPSQNTPVISATSTEFPSELLYRVLPQEAGMPGMWRARLTNLGECFEYTLKLDYQDEFYEYWLANRHIGQPFTGPIPLADGYAVYCERGCIWKGPASDNEFVLCDLIPPLLGKPALLNPSVSHERKFGLLRWRTSVEMRDKIKARQPSLFTRAWADKICLQEVVPAGKQTDMLPLQLITSELPNGCLDVIMVAYEWYQGETARITLKDSTLYNLSFRLPEGEVVILAPHAIYAKKSWENFGFIHATDLHLSRRLDGICGRLERVGMSMGSAEYNNYNDVFRELISYANHLHDIGMADFLVLTGDIVDFGFDSDDARRADWHLGAGNWAFFEKLLCGQAPSPDPISIPYEELRLPIFLVPGNHDYRINSHELLFDIDLQWPLPNPRVRLYGGMNLIEEEAKALQNNRIPWLSQEEGKKTVDIDLHNQAHSYDYFYERIIGKYGTSYIVKLDNHRLVMIDTKWDLGIPEGLWDAAEAWWNGGDRCEDMRQASTGAPNSQGFEASDLNRVRTSLQEAGPTGLVIIGLHAPPINAYGEATHSHYFRETEHPTADPEEVVGFLRRAAGKDPGEDNIRRWTQEWTKNGTPYFKRGGIDLLMDYGIAKDHAEDFLKLCLGIGTSHKVDLILSGHNHDRAEFRLGWDANANQFLFYTDFYTENPANYYLSRKNGFSQPIHINIREGAPLNGKVTTVRDHRPDAYWKESLVLEVPPYPKTLNSANNAPNWWEQHRPLIVETASLGPTDNNQRKNLQINPTAPSPAFQGFRLISIDTNVIQKIRYIAMSELRERGYRMPWEPPVEKPSTEKPSSEISRGQKIKILAFASLFLLWLAFGIVLLINPGLLDTIWELFQSWPPAIQQVVGLLLLPLYLGLLIWESSWPVLLRLAAVIGLALVTVFMFFPRKSRNKS